MTWLAPSLLLLDPLSSAAAPSMRRAAAPFPRAGDRACPRPHRPRAGPPHLLLEPATALEAPPAAGQGAGPLAATCFSLVNKADKDAATGLGLPTLDHLPCSDILVDWIKLFNSIASGC